MEVGPALHATANGRAWLSTLKEDDAQAQVRRKGFILPRNYAGSSVASEQQLAEELKQIREVGYAVSADESVIGITAFAAPIPDREDGPALGSVSVAGPSVRMPLSRAREILPDLLAAAKELGGIWPIPRFRKLATTG
ncbi:IclR family transcriptional regulator C-terminal domain-containing protein [Sinorhizobium terangae]|nr:IclR family transcriptional regulator C-terminal domain-containing protein [Sinorhizobium terangae]